MSRYSGCCDFCDTLEIHEYTLEELQNNVKIYVGDSKEPLRFEKMTDVIPYYPYVVGSAGYDNVERTATIYLTSKSYVDIEEQRHLESMLKYLLKIYNRCKRKKIEFDVEEAVKEICWYNWNEDACRRLAERVKANGKKATTDDIHLKAHEYYRQNLVDEMIKNGLNIADYGGYERFCGVTNEK